ncbi:hypothetical protein [Stenotrophomonas rhizophila]|uniref:hypothetical protein n=1 Tax=Stenotrophomonas rhizophila TaxID=216778 RepID=UPI0028D5A7D6|nr:hypothetical protein [Stenotrophomonas rhizophila]
MNESVFMQVTMDAGLRASFQQAAARERRPAAQVLQALMREYVARHSGAGEALDVAGADQDLDEMAHRQQGWHCCPFGTG